MSHRRLFTLSLAAALAVSSVTAALASTTVVVSEPDLGIVKPTDPGDVVAAWGVADTRPGGSVAFIPDVTSPLGGAVQFSTADANAKAQLVTNQFVGLPLADLETLSYAEFRDASSTNVTSQRVSLNLEVGGFSDGTTFTTLVFEPVYNLGQGALQDGQWQTWDAIDGGAARWWSTRAVPGVPNAFESFVPLSAIVAANPDARIVGVVGFNVGSGWAGEFLGRADALTINDVTFDFEPAPSATKHACKDGGWRTLTDGAGDGFRNQGDCVSYVASDGRTRAGR